MTREEAIDYLIALWGSDNTSFDETIALDMVIEALEQEPCEDAISRSELKKELMSVIPEQDAGLLSDLCDIIDSLPPVISVEKVGHLEWVQYDYNFLGNWHCSECRCVVVECVDKNEKGGIPLYKYCPNCGAKMIEPQESEDKE